MKSDPYEMLSNGGKLVQKWRLSGALNEITASATDKRAPVGIYLDPVTGYFYARIPETEDGALYCGTNLGEFRGVLHEALRDLPEGPDSRTWTRWIRVHYSTGHGVEHPPGWRRPQDHANPAPWEAPGWWDLRNLHGGTAQGRNNVGPICIARIERAPRPGGGYDVREWEEDFQVRLARWEVRDTPSASPIKPRRHVGAEQGTLLEVIELPWSPETWADLQNLQQRIRELDLRVRAFFHTNPAELPNRLTAMRRLIEAPSEQP